MAGRRGESGEGRPVTKIIDRCQTAVRTAGAEYRASQGDRATSCVVPRGAPPRHAARRVYAACFVSKHLVPLWNSLPRSTHRLGGVRSHLSGSCHRWYGRCSHRRRIGRLGTMARGAFARDEPDPKGRPTASAHDGQSEGCQGGPRSAMDGVMAMTIRRASSLSQGQTAEFDVLTSSFLDSLALNAYPRRHGNS